jgi:hypothetical protein
VLDPSPGASAELFALRDHVILNEHEALATTKAGAISALPDHRAIDRLLPAQR